MKISQFYYFVLPALILLVSDKAFALNGLRNGRNDEAQDDPRNLKGSSSTKSSSSQSSSSKTKSSSSKESSSSAESKGSGNSIETKSTRKVIADYCHVKGIGSCNIKESEECAMETFGRCTIGNSHCQVYVSAKCAPAANNCTVTSETATTCDNGEGFRTVSGAGATSSATAMSTRTFAMTSTEAITPPGDDGLASSNANANAEAFAPFDRALEPTTNATVRTEGESVIFDDSDEDEDCLADTEGEATCVITDGLCELNVDKICIVWVDADDDEDEEDVSEEEEEEDF